MSRGHGRPCSGGSPVSQCAAEVLCRGLRLRGLSRRRPPNDIVYNFDGLKHKLPVVRTPEAGYSHSSVVSVLGLPDVTVRVVFDGGAESTSISDRAMSRIMRAQGAANLPEEDCPLRNLSRMDPPQRFYSYNESQGGTIVDIIARLTLATVHRVPLPSLLVKMVYAW